MNDRTKDWAMIAALAIQTVGIIVYVSQTVQRLEDRLTVLENQQTISRAIEDKLNTAREETNNHFTTTDLKITDLAEKLNAVLEVLQQESSSPPPDGGMQMGAPTNFPRRPPGGR